MQKRKLVRSIFSLFVVLALVFQLASPLVAFAAISDKDTTTKYSESLGDNASTEYAGRVWTDKSVFTEDVEFVTYGGGTAVVEIDPDADEEFLISYSALATSESISGQSQAPVDVVLILDISGSMSNGSSNMDNGKSRIYNTVQAANAAIDELMGLNDYTRVSVVVFSSNAQVLLPLDRYEKVTTTERQWVQTGSGRYDGYWDNVEVEVPYFTLNRESASDNYADLTANAKRVSNGRTVNVTVDVEGGTNIQMGLYEGMQVLAEEDETTANINGAQIQRVPSVILLSDGSPTYSSNSGSWWAPSDNSDDGPGSAPYAGNGMKAILVGAYMKAAIDRNYGVTGTAYATTVYTVGMGITGLDDNEKNLAYMTLDPGTYWNDTEVTNSMKTTIKGYWSDYTRNNNTGNLNINVGQQVLQGNRWVYQNKNYALTHPTTGYDVDPTSGYDYVDDYYDADNASAVTSVFEQIVSNISITAPQVPTEIKGNDPLTDGYITYTDPIGQYMEVKDVKSLIYAGTEFTQKSVTTTGNVTTYEFSGSVHSPVYGDQEIKNIIITVTKAQSGDETLTIKIPASVIPLRVNEVQLNEDGSVKSHTNNGAFPARVIYSVGLQDGIKKVSDDGHEYVDATKLTEAYMLANTNTDGTINFYSNVYTGTNQVNGYSAGNATVEFEPSHNNPFYYIQEDMPIYKDTAFANQVTEEEGLDADTTYYYKEEYYHGTTVEVKAIARTGAQLTREGLDIVTGTDGYLYRAAGSPRLNRILEFEGTKSANATNTAADFYAPTFQHADGSTDPYEGKFVIYLGNNGVMSLAAGGNLQISKTVATAAGLTAPGETFTFTLDLDGTNVNSGEYTYVIRDAAGTQVSTGTVSQNSPTISLTDGQVATVYSLPPAVTYSITEAAVAGFATESTGATGIIHAGQTQYAAFTNTYSVAPVTGENIEGTKILAGLTSWPSNYRFTFFLNPYNNGPLPAGYDADKGVSVGVSDANGTLQAEFEFGAIEFTAPGTYRYTVVEKEPENDGYLPGMTYSRALFRLVYVVVDDGAGNLRIQSTDIQRLYDDGANQLFTYNAGNQIVMNPGEEGQDDISFTNTYRANSVTRIPVALKAYSDPSGTKPLVSGMFRFQLKAIGYIVDNGTLQTDITKVPMPAGTQNGLIVTSNEGHDITFPSVTFTQALLTDNGASKMTYRYEMSEVIPADGDKVPGMTYDDTTYTVDVVVELNTAGTDLLVSAIYPDGLRIATFSNSYSLQSVTADINGTKTLNGRDMLAGETFQFSLVGADAATNNAIRNQYVTVPESTASVQGGTDGQKLAFSFEDIEFTHPGIYSFAVSEVAGSAPSVQYDDSIVVVTFEVADTNGDAKLEVVSTTYSDGGSTADFVNTYTYRFDDAPISLTGTKTLTGKTLMAGEFYFDVVSYYNGTQTGEGLVTHTADSVGVNGTYTGSISFLEDVTYAEPGTYTYLITEQIPDDELKVGGTTYDDAQYRYTVVVIDDNQGSLKVDSTKLEKAVSGGWTDADAVVFENTYEAAPTTAHLPLIKKVITGDRKDALRPGEFSFQMALASAQPADGIILPANTVVYNSENGDIAFGGITFTKAGTYAVKITEIIPEDAQKVPGINYSTQELYAVFHVTDDRNGNLMAVLTQFDGGDTIINEYAPDPITYTPVAKKVHDGEAMRTFDFVLTDVNGVFAAQTKQNDSDGNVVFDTLTFTEEGTYEFIITEQENVLWDFIKWDTNQYTLTITVVNDSGSQLLIEPVVVSSLFGRDDLIFRNAHEDTITKKEVAFASDPDVKIDGKKVEHGDELLYTISYTNYTGLPADVTIIDTVPQYTTYVDNSAGDGVYANGEITWTLTAVPAYETVTVSFKVEVTADNGTITNQANVLEGNNTYSTEAVTNPIVEDEVEKDVFLATDPNTSIDGEKVNVGDILQYTITYHNADDAPATVEIIDRIPANTTFVEGTAGDAVYTNGELKWTLTMAAGERKTVSFQVKVNEADAFIDNQAIGNEAGNQIFTNLVTNHTFEEVEGKDVVLADQPTISIDGKQVQIGQILQYTIDYTNITDAPVDVTITDKIPQYTELRDAGNGTVNGDTITWQLSAVQPRQKVTVTFQVEVAEPGAVIENQAQIFDGTNKLTNKVTNSVPGKSVDKQQASLGDVLTYTLTYTNTTGAPAKVVITDELSDALTYVDGTAGDGVYADGTITWTMENIPAGETVTVSFQAKVAGVVGSVANKAQVIENDANAAFTNETVTSVKTADLTVKKEQAVGSGEATTDKLTVKEGDEVTYILTVTNNGEGDAYGISVTDKLPEGLIPVDGSISNGGVYADGTITWTLDALEAGDSAELTFKVKVPSVEKDTTWTNVATFAYGNDPDGEDDVTKSNEVQIEEEVPVSTPQTGDSFNAGLFISLMILSSFGLAAVLVCKKQEEKKETAE